LALICRQATLQSAREKLSLKVNCFASVLASLVQLTVGAFGFVNFSHPPPLKVCSGSAYFPSLYSEIASQPRLPWQLICSLPPPPPLPPLQNVFLSPSLPGSYGSPSSFPSLPSLTLTGFASTPFPPLTYPPCSRYPPLPSPPLVLFPLSAVRLSFPVPPPSPNTPFSPPVVLLPFFVDLSLFPSPVPFPFPRLFSFFFPYSSWADDTFSNLHGSNASPSPEYSPVAPALGVAILKPLPPPRTSLLHYFSPFLSPEVPYPLLTAFPPLNSPFGVRNCF